MIYPILHVFQHGALVGKERGHAPDKETGRWGDGLANPNTVRKLDAMKTLEELPIKIDREKIAAFCRERGIRKMSLFGSVVRDDFDPERSDVDVLVEFAPGRTPGYAFVDYQETLEQLLGRKVDLMSRLNKYLWPLVKPELMPIYEQAA